MRLPYLSLFSGVTEIAGKRTLCFMRSIVLKVNNEGVLWNGQDGIPWSATNLPASTFCFREQETFYWEVQMQAYNANRGQLRVRVIDYWETAHHFDDGLAPKQSVRSIVFDTLEAAELKQQLSYYQLGELAPFLATSNASVPPPAPASPPLPDAKSPTATHAVSFKVSLLDLTFGDGKVSGQVELPGVLIPLSFVVENDHLIAEFEAVKPFFVRALKRKLVEVKAELSFNNDEPRLERASSPQIARIDERMLQVFRARSLRQLLGTTTNRAADKSLFTPDEFFDALQDDSPGKALLPSDGAELLTEILRHRKVRNAKQLLFLADRLHLPGAPLRYVLSPRFGFVFLAEGQDGNHFILELLDSHATYIWSIPSGWKTLEGQYRTIEREIQSIALLGRGQYRRSLQFEHEFWLVVHQHAGSEVVDGFPRWRQRLLEGLV